MRDDRIFTTISALRDRPDEAATRELFTHFESSDPSVKLAAAMVLYGRPFPEDLRERAAAPLFDEHFSGETQLVTWVFQCAAQALLEQPAAKAFQQAAPLLRGHALETPMGVRRAWFVLGEIEDCLAVASTLRGPERERAMPDPRFRALCEPLQQSHQEDLRYLATKVVKGFRYFQGEEVRPALSYVWLGQGDTPPFPFLVAGFRMDGGARGLTGAWEESGPIPPEGLCWFDHQYGGYTCSQAAFLGYGVVAPDTPRTSAALEELVRTSFGTWGEEMTSEERSAWAERLSDVLPPPGVEQGFEGMLLGHPGAPLHTLRGADVLGFGTTRAPWRGVVHTSAHDPDIVRCGRYDEAHEQVLTSLGQTFGLGKPRIIVLWGNSD